LGEGVYIVEYIGKNIMELKINPLFDIPINIQRKETTRDDSRILVSFHVLL